ncbi:MAG: rRNA maturation RNase YbeY, partial [Planctomycetota bacterium]
PATPSADRDEGSADPDSSPEPDEPPDPGPDSRTGGPSATSVEIECASDVPGLGDLDLPWLEARLAEAIAQISRPIGRVGVCLADDAMMRRQHRKYSGRERTTDVLAFETSASPDPIEVDIIVSVDEAARAASRLGHAIERELLLYCLHGVLHCAGFDDKSADDYEAMHAEEDRILSAIGVGPTFHAGGRDTETAAPADSANEDRAGD